MTYDRHQSDASDQDNDDDDNDRGTVPSHPWSEIFKDVTQPSSGALQDHKDTSTAKKMSWNIEAPVFQPRTNL